MSREFSMTDCIEWPKSKTTAGYGQLKRDGKKIMAHRFVWEKAYGPIPKGMCICHRCDNPPCVNLEHLFLGTHGDNIRDCYAKKRRRLASKPKVSEQTAVRLKMLYGVVPVRQLAIALGVSSSYVKNIMTGKRFPHVTAQTRYTF